MVVKKPEAKQPEESKQEKLKVAWRYNDLVEEKMLGENQVDSKHEAFRFDNSKPMGDALSN